MPWGNNPLYAVLHESIYCQGARSSWAAHRVREDHFKDEFDAVKAAQEGRQVNFTGLAPLDCTWALRSRQLPLQNNASNPTCSHLLQMWCLVLQITCIAKVEAWGAGEMVFPWMFEDFAELRPLRDAAHLIAAKGDWPQLYDEAVLRKNEVPIAAACYFDDM